MDDPRLVFKYKFERLQELLKGAEQAQLLDVAAILRHLLLEGQSLMDIVNREFRLTIRFHVARSATEQVEQFPIAGIKPTFTFCGTTWAPYAPTRELNKDQFLAFDMIYLEGVKFSVKEIIDLCANQLGGVHYDTLSTERKATILRELSKTLYIGGASTALASLLLIGKTTVAALEQLYQQVCIKVTSGSAP